MSVRARSTILPSRVKVDATRFPLANIKIAGVIIAEMIESAGSDECPAKGFILSRFLELANGEIRTAMKHRALVILLYANSYDVKLDMAKYR